MRVLKFGGTSVGTPERIHDVVTIVRQCARRDQVAVVVSAFSKVTDQLLALAAQAAQGDERYQASFEELQTRHLAAVDQLTTIERRSRTRRQVERTLSDLRDLLHGLSLIREQTPRTLDVAASFGERLSATIVAAAFQSHGIEAEVLDSRRVVRTDAHFGAAHVLADETARNIRRYFARKAKLQVITGFIGSTRAGETTTLGRGGSDYTAALVGAALDAKAVEIWTDVDGFMTADPRSVPGAHVVTELDYAEAAELAHFGANVLYPPTIRPTVAGKIPIIIKNTLHPAAGGTRIAAKNLRSNGPVTGVTSQGRIGLLQLRGSGMQGVPGFAARLFGALAAHEISVILITQASSEHSICVAIDEARLDDAAEVVAHEFHHEFEFGDIEQIDVEQKRSIVAVVGKRMRSTPGVAGKTFQALGEHGINIVAIAQGSSELNISIVVRSEDEAQAVRVIHDTFFH